MSDEPIETPRRTRTPPAAPVTEAPAETPTETPAVEDELVSAAEAVGGRYIAVGGGLYRRARDDD